MQHLHSIKNKANSNQETVDYIQDLENCESKLIEKGRYEEYAHGLLLDDMPHIFNDG